MIAFFEWFAHSAWGWAFAAIWGSLWGSFANVCIFRLPLNLSLVSPASRCPNCHQTIAWFDNLPLISFACLGGKCRYCRQSISWQYPIIELFSVGLVLLTFWRFVWLEKTSVPIALQFGRLIAYGHFGIILLVLSAIDLKHFLIPDRVTLPATISYFVAAYLLGDIHWADSLIGLLVGYFVLWLVGTVYFYLTRREGLGLGDAKLLALIGATLGWRAIPWTILVASVAGTLVSAPFLCFYRKRTVTTQSKPQHIPFGPFLAFAALSYLFLFLNKSFDEIIASVYANLDL